MSARRGWIGVDLDGTLAVYDGWVSADHIGAPVPRMVERVKLWLREGSEVRIFTARVYCPEDTPPYETEATRRVIEAWCLEHIGAVLRVTCQKDYGMITLWDDRATQVVPNTGEALEERIAHLMAAACPKVAHCARDGCVLDQESA